MLALQPGLKMPTPDTLDLPVINPNPKPKKPGTFGRGNPPPGKGRMRGSVNKVTRDLKNGILTAAANLGRDSVGTDGLVGYLVYLGAHHPKAFAGLLAKMLPLQVNADVNNAVVGAINVVSIPRDRFLSMAEPEKFRPALENGLAAHIDQA